MSVHVSSAVWKYAPLSGTRLLVLLALADWANDQGTCWPSVASIADRCRIDARRARRILRELEHEGLIKKVREGGRDKPLRMDAVAPGWSSVYRIQLDALTGVSLGEEASS